MKQFLTLLFFLILIAGCNKEQSANTTGSTNLLTTKVTYSHTDTTTAHLSVRKIALSSTPSATVQINYAGNSRYTFTVYLNGALTSDFELYRNGVLYDSNASSSNPLNISLTAGTYYCSVRYIDDADNYLYVQTSSYTIVAEPASPAGMICLYRYFNPTSGQHICTYDWEELGSTNVGFNFEKVLGYTYPSATSASNLKPIYRYYKSSDGSHFTTDIAGTYSGFVFEKILGYVGTAATATLSRSLTKYYRSSDDDHFVCVAPDVPNTTGYTEDIDFIFGYLQ